MTPDTLPLMRWGRPVLGFRTCERPGCVVVFGVGQTAPGQRFCSRSCAGYRLRANDAWRQQCRTSGMVGGRASGLVGSRRARGRWVQAGRTALLDVRTDLTPTDLDEFEGVLRLVYTAGYRNGLRAAHTRTDRTRAKAQAPDVVTR